MNIVVAIAAFLIGGYVSQSLEIMTPERMNTIESQKNKNENFK